MSIASPLTATDLATALRAVVHGDVVTADEPSYPAATFGLRADDGGGPELVVVAAEAADVAATVRVAARAGRRVVVQTPGRPTMAPTAPAVLVLTRLLAGVRLDPRAGTALVGAGSTWRQVMAAADRFGLAAVPAPVPGRGAVGHDATRRFGPVGRSFGFAAGLVRSYQVVTPAGELHEVDDRTDPALFGQLRRGAGSGWVTAMTIRLVPAERVYAGGMWFDADDAHAVAARWRRWSRELPGTATTSIARLDLPPVSEVPPPLRGRSVIHVRLVQHAHATGGERMFDAIRSVATPLLDASAIRSPGPAAAAG